MGDNEDCHIPGEPIKTLVALVFVVVGLCISTLSLAMTHDRLPNVTSLPDVVLDNVPYQPWGLDACEYIIVVSTVVAAIIVLFHEHRWENNVTTLLQFA